MVHSDECFFSLLKETSPIISFNWGRCVEDFYTSNFLSFSLLCSQGLIFPCESEYFFLFLFSPFLESYKLRQKIITWRSKTGRFPRHLKLMSCWVQNIPCLWLCRCCPVLPLPPFTSRLTHDLTFWLCLPFGYIAALKQHDGYKKWIYLKTFSLFANQS